MSTIHRPSVVLTDLSFAWPDATPVFSGLTAAFNSGRTGLIGDNGCGKSTLLRLIAGQLRPTGGTVTVSGTVGWLPQNLTLRPFMTVAELLGIDQKLAALRAIEAGSVAVADFDALGTDWDIDSRARAALDSAGLEDLSLDRPVGTLSGGETVLTALTGLRLAGDSVVLLDEPTNNLDRAARQRLYDTITAWTGALIIVSHDVALLELMDDTAELYDGSLSVFGGPYSAYRAHLEAEQEAASQALRTAEQQLRREQRQRVEAQTKLARRQRYARTDFENKRKPKMIMNQRKTEAQVSAGKLRGELDAKVTAAQEAADQQSERIRAGHRIIIDLPDPDVHSGRRLAELRSATGTSVVVQGRQRIALTGANGIGKTQLVASLLQPPREGQTTPQIEAIAHTNRTGLLPQRLDHLDDDLSILDAVAAAAPGTPPGQLRKRLARFQFRAETVHRLLGDLSGGERFRVALAALLLADPPHQLLVLDEPTNSLDLASVDALVSALEDYRGGLIIVSHDDAFLSRCQPDTWLELDTTGLHRIDPPTPQEDS